MSVTPHAHISLRTYTTLHIGGEAEFFLSAELPEDIRDGVLWAHERGMAWRVIGGGSNILFGDGVIPGLTIRNGCTGMTTEETAEGILLHASAGEMLDEVVAYTCARGWWGLENLSAIPGTVGATPIQNVGAYGVEVADHIVSVSVYDADADAFRTMSPEECAFSYRHSVFKEEKGRRLVVLSVSFLLPRTQSPVLTYRDVAEYCVAHPGADATPQAVREMITTIRAGKFPDWHILGTAGSFFKNPLIDAAEFARLARAYAGLPGHPAGEGKVKVSLGWILDKVCGMRGVREGEVGTYGAQALVLVNYGGATAHDVRVFSEMLTALVKEKTGISITREVTEIFEK